MRNYRRKLSWALVLGFLTIPGAGKAAAQALASDSATITHAGSVAGQMFLDIIGRGNPFAAPSFSVVQFNGGDLGLSGVTQVTSVTLDLTEGLFGAASKGPMAFYVTEDTTTDIEPGTTPLMFDLTTPSGVGTQLAPLHFLGNAKFKPVRTGTVDLYTFAVTDPNLQSYLAAQINAGDLIRFVIAPVADAHGHEATGGAFAGFMTATPTYIPALTVVAQ
jgi:hypothetical protein